MKELLLDILVYSIPYYLTFIVVLLFKGVSYKIIVLIVIGQALVAYIMSMEFSVLDFKNKDDKVAYRVLFYVVMFTSIVFCIVKEINEGVTILIVLLSVAIFCTISYIVYTTEKDREEFEHDYK